MPKTENDVSLVDNITDFADPDLGRGSAEHSEDTYSDSYEENDDREWSYDKDEDEDEDELSDDDLWEEEKKPRKKSSDTPAKPAVPTLDSKLNIYMTAILWFNDINARGFMTEKESKYIGLLLIELEKFFFDKQLVDKLPPSVHEALRSIQEKIGGLY